MMYRLSYILLLAAAFMAAAVCCTKVSAEGESDALIEFDVTATKVADTEFEPEDIINVLGFLVHDDTSEKEFGMSYMGRYASDGIVPLSFSYSAVNVEGIGTGKVYPSGYYWPKFDSCEYQSLYFYAYYAYNETSSGGQTTGPTVRHNTGAAPSFDYVMNVEGEAKKEDFLVTEAEASAGVVGLDFVRPLAKVVWKVCLEDWKGSFNIDLLFEDLLSECSYSMELNDWVASATSVTSDMTVTYGGEGGVVPGNSDTPMEVASFYLIPQKIDKFAVVYNYHKEAVSLETPLEFIAGKRHTITVTISKDKVVRIDTDGGEKVWDAAENTNEIK